MYDGGIKTLGLHLRATRRERSVAHFRVAFFVVDFTLLCIPAVSTFEHNEIKKVSLFFENVLTGCKYFYLSSIYQYMGNKPYLKNEYSQIT